MKWFLTWVRDDEERRLIGRIGLFDAVLRQKIVEFMTPNDIKPEGLKDFVQGYATSTTDYEHEFRLLDDDGIVIYEGLCKGLDDAGQDTAFAPLDWAMDNYGCTEMQYRLKGSKADWRTL